MQPPCGNPDTSSETDLTRDSGSLPHCNLRLVTADTGIRRIVVIPIVAIHATCTYMGAIQGPIIIVNTGT